jgi:hypothetical protein
MKKNLPIGISDFETMIDANCYYIDKSLMIKEILETTSAVTLLPRPRRFGKTLNLSMLQYFFEKNKESKLHLFNGLAIAQDSKSMEHQGQYPIVFLTFKDVKSDEWEMCYKLLRLLISKEFARHAYLLNGDTLTFIEKKLFNDVMNLEADEAVYQNSLKDLIDYLARYHQKKVIILIDEYDTPVLAGYHLEYHKKVISFMRGFLGSGLKDQKDLFRAIITGILCIAKESIFSGLNNLDVCALMNDAYADRFGLLERDVHTMLEHYGLVDKIDEVRAWYNGYKSGQHTIYNPWSIIHLIRNNGFFQAYWVNTSDNQLIKDLALQADQTVKDDFQLLIEKKTINKTISDNIVFENLNSDTSTFWSLMLMTGYLTYQNKETVVETVKADLLIPNTEILALFKTIITGWFEQSAGKLHYDHLLASLVSGDITSFKKIFSRVVASCLSYFDVGGDEPERFYHAFVLGMLVSLMKTHAVKSNRESGYGRYDVMIIPHDKSKPSIIIEFKRIDLPDKETLEQIAQEALQQIEDKQYEQELRDLGFTNIIKLGIAFQGKQVLVLEKE